MVLPLPFIKRHPPACTTHTFCPSLSTFIAVVLILFTFFLLDTVGLVLHAATTPCPACCPHRVAPVSASPAIASDGRSLTPGDTILPCASAFDGNLRLTYTSSSCWKDERGGRSPVLCWAFLDGFLLAGGSVALTSDVFIPPGACSAWCGLAMLRTLRRRNFDAAAAGEMGLGRHMACFCLHALHVSFFSLLRAVAHAPCYERC